MPRTTVRVRPSRGMSLVGAVVGLGMLVFAAGNGAPGFFVVAVLAVVGLNLYNAFSERGVATNYFEVDSADDPRGQERTWSNGRYCTACGMSTAAGDKFCRECGGPTPSGPPPG